MIPYLEVFVELVLLASYQPVRQLHNSSTGAGKEGMRVENCYAINDGKAGNKDDSRSVKRWFPWRIKR